MKKTLTIFCFALGIASIASAKKSKTVKIQTVAESQYQVKGDYTYRFVNAVIDGQHVRLSCIQWHNVYATNAHCSDLGPATYDGTHEDNNIFIFVPVPLSKKVQREHWKIAGSW